MMRENVTQEREREREMQEEREREEGGGGKVGKNRMERGKVW